MNNLNKFDTKDPIVFAASYIRYLGEVLDAINLNEIQQFINTLNVARKSGSTIFFIGNGGSAATASHFANDIAVGANRYEKPFRAISLTDNQAIITAIANDFGFEEIFSRQLMVLGKPGDVVVAISASGNSINLINAFTHAKKIGIKTVSITGFDGGKLKSMADEFIHIPTGYKEYGPAEDAHMVLDHLVSSYLIYSAKDDQL